MTDVQVIQDDAPWDEAPGYFNPEPKESKGRAGSRSVEEYRDMGYTTAPMDQQLRDFIDLYAILDLPPERKGDKYPGCVAECIEICQINALQDLDDLRNLSRRWGLGNYFPAKVALRFENALESPEMLFIFKKLDESDKKPWANTFHFTYSIESMESTCATYGILSALLLTMNVGSFGAIQIEEWAAFESGIALERCNVTSLLRWSSGRPGETVGECVKALSAESEKWFIVSNFGASLSLILTLLLSSWLYIAFGIPGANRTRPDEVQAVVARLSGEFATLNVLFLFSVALSGTGILQLTQIKIRSWNLVVFLSTIAIVTFIGICVLASWLIWEMGNAKRALNEIRTVNKNEIAKPKKFWYLWLKERLNRKVVPLEQPQQSNEKFNLKKEVDKYKQDNRVHKVKALPHQLDNEEVNAAEAATR